MSNKIDVTDIIQRAGMLRGTVKIDYEIDVVVGYSGNGDKEALEMILKAQALEQLRQDYDF